MQTTLIRSGSVHVQIRHIGAFGSEETIMSIFKSLSVKTLAVALALSLAPATMPAGMVAEIGRAHV